MIEAMGGGVFRVPASTCPGCGTDLDAVGQGARADEAPRPGDLTVCCQCYRVLIFNAALVPRDLTPAERARLDADAELQLDLENLRLRLMAFWPKGTA